MEPIRPDDDELRAERPFGASEQKAPVQKKPKPSAESAGGKSKPPKPAKGGGNDKGGGSGRSGLGVLWLLVIAVAVASLAGWYSQNQRILMLEGQLEEADYWVRQSKLALARFEGDLSETGESFQERGASLGDQIDSQKKQLDEADSEIRKLWVIANERNKKRLDDHQERIAAAESGLAESKKALADVGSTVEKVRTSLGADVAALTKQTETSVAALEDANRQASEQLTSLSKQLADVDQVVERRVRRFEQEQKLGISGIEGRLSALEKKLADLSGNDRDRELVNELAAVKRNVEAIDSSRAQVTSRLVRLSEEVNQLRSQVSGQ
jgi:chromosome segregation ATPase